MSLRCPVADFEAREAARRAKIDEEAAHTTQPHFEIVERAGDKYVSLAAWSKISWGSKSATAQLQGVCC
jgi:hypothetical protein